eukprot:16452341-Heterocapsa_arctica.AAC.1
MPVRRASRSQRAGQGGEGRQVFQLEPVFELARARAAVHGAREIAERLLRGRIHRAARHPQVLLPGPREILLDRAIAPCFEAGGDESHQGGGDRQRWRTPRRRNEHPGCPDTVSGSPGARGVDVAINGHQSAVPPFLRSQCGGNGGSRAARRVVKLRVVPPQREAHDPIATQRDGEGEGLPTDRTQRGTG